MEGIKKIDIHAHAALFPELTPLRTWDQGRMLSGKELACIYDDGKIFENVTFNLKRLDRVAILGDNGTGKSTILKMITGLKDIAKGTVKLGSNVIIGYYDQAQMNLTDDNTIFDEVHNMYPDMNNTDIRNALAALGFYNDDLISLLTSSL